MKRIRRRRTCGYRGFSRGSSFFGFKRD